MHVNGLQIPSHNHLTVLQQVSNKLQECTEKPGRPSSQEAAEKRIVYPPLTLPL